jgi:D-beta-D-heptose 7-phosphate kinase/D-beta-D-heptose 1-phosphate adenosyltransferase
MAEASVALLGDIVLDRYLMGSTSRVSREAPIPVVLCDREKDNLGGAGNVAMNLRGMGCRVYLAGVIGRDAEASRVRSHLERNGIAAMLFERDSPTLTKTRLICGEQQVARFDHEILAPPDKREADEALSWLKELLDDGSLNAVILSDYGLGFCTPRICEDVIAAARLKNVPVFIDPRGNNWRKYRGATIATPNLAELSAAHGAAVANEDEAVEQAGKDARRRAALDWLLVTRSSRGMTLIGKKGATHIDARPIEVYDVSGAGDTVIACLAASFGVGFSIDEAARFANEAAQIVVTRSGTYPITASDLLDAPGKRVVGRESAASLCQEWRAKGRRVIFTNGCFDILHAGHVDSLERARLLGDCLIVGLNSDRSVRALKGNDRPVNGEDVRARLLAALRAVDLVVVFDEDTPAELLSKLRPNVLAKGSDYKADELPGREFVDEVAILPLVEGFSTTETIRRVGKTKARV